MKERILKTNMKTVANFLNFVEIKTKLASVIPFLAGAGFTLYRYGRLDFYRTAVFFIAMLLFDMTTTAINNHIGTREQKQEDHYPNGISLLIIFVMLVASTVLGVYLVSITNIVVLLVGVFCFGVGILYSFGPLPIARTPFGEMISGAVEGTCIPFLVYVINDPAVFLITLSLPKVSISLDLFSLIGFGVSVLPIICCIANIMLANNTCDLAEDIKVGRYTLPYYIGKEACLKLFKWLYIIAYVFIVIGAVSGALPLTALIGLLPVGLVLKNIQIFQQRQVKSETFDTAIKNFVLILVPYTLGIWLPWLWHLAF